MSEQAILWRMFLGAVLVFIVCAVVFVLSGFHVFWLFAAAGAAIFSFFTFMGALMG